MDQFKNYFLFSFNMTIVSCSFMEFLSYENLTNSSGEFRSGMAYSQVCLYFRIRFVVGVFRGIFP